MASGDALKVLHSSPIIQAIADAERGTTGEIRVHLSKRLREKDAFKHASSLFDQFGMSRTSHSNAVLLYVNLRRRKFAVVADHGIQKAVGNRYWEQLALELTRDLRETHPERAIAMAVTSVGRKLKEHFSG